MKLKLKKKKLKNLLNIINKKLNKKLNKKIYNKKIFKFKSIKISLASSTRIKKWTKNFNTTGAYFKNHKILNAKTFNYKTLIPEKGGLFCEQIFGTLKTQSRRYNLGYIELISPVVHIWYLKGSTSYISLLLNLKKKKLESITYCSEVISGQVASFDNNLTFENFNSLINQKFLYFNSQSNKTWRIYLFHVFKNSKLLIKKKFKNFFFIEFSFLWIKFLLIYSIFFSLNLNTISIFLKKKHLKLNIIQVLATKSLKNKNQCSIKNSITYYTLDFPLFLFYKSKNLKTYFLNFYNNKNFIITENLVPNKNFFVIFPLFFDKKFLKSIFFYNQNFFFYNYNFFFHIDVNVSTSTLVVKNNVFSKSINYLTNRISVKKKLSKHLTKFYIFEKNKFFNFNNKPLKKKLKNLFFSKIFLIKSTQFTNFIVNNHNVKYYIFKQKQIIVKKKNYVKFNLIKIQYLNKIFLFSKIHYYLYSLIKINLLSYITWKSKLKKKINHKKYFYSIFSKKKNKFFDYINFLFIQNTQQINYKYFQIKKKNSFIFTKLFQHKPLFSAACFSLLNFQKNIKFFNLFKFEFTNKKNLTKLKEILELNSKNYNYIFFLKKNLLQILNDQKILLLQLKFKKKTNKKTINKLNQVIKYNYKIFYFPMYLKTKFYNINKFLVYFFLGLELLSNKINWFNFSTKYLKNYNYTKIISLEKDFFLKKNFNLHNLKTKQLKNPLGNKKFRNFLLRKLTVTLNKNLIISKIKKTKFLFRNFSITNNIVTKTTNFSTKITLNDNLNPLTSFFSPTIYINKEQGIRYEQKKIIYFILKTFHFLKLLFQLNNKKNLIKVRNNLLKQNKFWSLEYTQFFLPTIIDHKKTTLKQFGSYKGIITIPLNKLHFFENFMLITKKNYFIITNSYSLTFIKNFVSKFYLEVIGLDGILTLNFYDIFLNLLINSNVFFNYSVDSIYFLNTKFICLNQKKKIAHHLIKNLKEFIFNTTSNCFNKYYIINQSFTWLAIDEWQNFLSYATQLSIKNDKIIPNYLERGLCFNLPLTGAVVIKNLLKNLKFFNNFNDHKIVPIFFKSKKKKISIIELLILHIQRKIVLLNQKLQYFEEFLKFKLILIKRNKKKYLSFSDEVITEIYHKIELLRFLRIRYFRRIKLMRPFLKKNIKPEWMVLNILPVLPPDLRPVVLLNDNQMAVSDLNKLYQKVIIRNRRLKRLFTTTLFSTFSPELRYAQRLLQESVDALIENGKADTNSIVTLQNRPLKSLSDLLKGKKGRFRLNLLGKRVDYSGRSVIVSGPSLQFYECGLPKQMALELFQPFLIRYLFLKKLATNFTKAKNLIQQKSNIIWKILEKIMDSRPILLNRAPTLHRLGIQSFKPKLIKGRAILLHPLVCSAFNADFDGDQMAVHIPLSYQACAEAWKLMWSRNNIRSSATGESIVVPSQDMVLGCYYLTTIDYLKRFKNFSFCYFTFTYWKNFQLYKNFEFNIVIFYFYLLNKNNFLKLPSFNKNDLFFTNIDQVCQLLNQNKLYYHDIIWFKCHFIFELIYQQQFCYEIQINKNGNIITIYSEYKTYFNYKFNIKQFYIKTTPGRVLMNQLILAI